jgi:ketosteroid isomerase-like protein
MAGKEQLIRGLVDAWNRRDLDSIAPLVAPDFEWVEWAESPVDAAGRGAGAVERLTADLDEGFEGYRGEVVEYHDVDDQRALLIIAETARGSTSGAEVSSRFGYVVTVRDGKVARVEAYRNPEAARQAAARPA